MKTREWKWEDVRGRLQSMGVTREVVDCGKKWDNLMQQFKKVHKFQNLSGGKDYFKLASMVRRSKGFNFVMDRSVYDEMEAMTKGDHTIHPKNLADTGAASGVQMLAGAGGAGDTMATEGGGEAADEEQGSTKDSTFSAGSGGGYWKRKNMRQQTFEAVAEVMDKYGALMTSTMDNASKRQCSMMLRQCEILESKVEVQRKHYAAADEPQTAIDGGGKHVCARRRPWEEAGKHPRGQSGAGKGSVACPQGEEAPFGRSINKPASLARAKLDTANEEEEDDVFTIEEEAEEDNVSAPRGSSLQRSSDQSGAIRLVTPPPEAQQATSGWPALHAVPAASMERGGGEGAHQEALVASGRAIAGAAAGSSGDVGVVARAREEVPVVEREATRGDNKGEREDEDPLLSRVRRGGMARDLADRARLWVDDKAFWTTGEGRRVYNIVHETREYFVAIASGLQTCAVPRSVVMPKSSTTLTRIADPAQLQHVIARATAMENIALHILHGWVFKSGNRPRGFNVAFQYALKSVATGIARVMWYGEEWSNVVSATVCAHTIDLNMGLPLWFASANIEDRPEDDDMAAHREATVVCIAHAFRAAVQMDGIIDDGFILHDRLSRIADCFRLLLAACMWLMRMAEDDPHNHYEAFYFAMLVAKPTEEDKRCTAEASSTPTRRQRSRSPSPFPRPSVRARADAGHRATSPVIIPSSP
ncbi:hypothetical protein CBR_g160 [Chara braunii]|uniref:Myb-like domain-containing protein n=1 Tax=Chara braunii TaxID=69332 RepID=A0A388JLR2_CHABU|nr:hypothetical protein CBR_g160 [Chara braunii]|eukprot:GBG58760.1 hypothetical protein CBR_g160 [Chara braunii]